MTSHQRQHSTYICYFSSSIEWGFELYNDLQSRLPNLPVFGWLSMKDLTEDEEPGCSKYPDIVDIHYRNKYWQIFEFLDENEDQTLDVTFHLYGAYFDNRTLLPKGPMIRVISMVHSRFVLKIFYLRLKIVHVTETHQSLFPSVISGIMTPSLQWSLK